jgi:hypothetical protein
MPTFKLPLSGDVVQSINPFTSFMTGGQFGLVNINMGQSSAPDVEADVLSDVASYGKQIGRISDALLILLAHFHAKDAHEEKVIADLNEMLEQIARVKERHKRPALHPASTGSR